MTTNPPTETVSDCCGAKVSWENRKKDEILVEISYAICQKCHKDCKAVFRKNEDRIEAITRGIDRFLPMAMNPKATDDEWLNNWSSLKKYVTEAMREVITKVEPTETVSEKKELPNPDGPLGWIMTLNNQGELTVHPGSSLSIKICQSFRVKHEKNVFIKDYL